MVRLEDCLQKLGNRKRPRLTDDPETSSYIHLTIELREPEFEPNFEPNSEPDLEPEPEPESSSTAGT